MKKAIFSLLIFSISLVASAQQSWSNDPYHSRLGFVVKHLTISEINGQFSSFTIKVKTTKPDFTDMKVVAGKQIQLRGTAYVSRLRFGNATRG